MTKSLELSVTETIAFGNQACSPEEEKYGHCHNNTERGREGEITDPEQGIAEAVDQVKERVKV